MIKLEIKGIKELQANLKDFSERRIRSTIATAMTKTAVAVRTEMQRKMDAMQEQQTQLLTQLRKQLAAMPEPDPRKQSDSGEQMSQEEKRRQLLKLLAEIEKRINEENSRPKKRYISPATREEAYAVYYDALRRKVEDKGTENFPEQGGKKLYGELIMIVTVNHDGRVLSTEVVQGSGKPALDRRAEAIARAAEEAAAKAKADADAEAQRKIDEANKRAAAAEQEAQAERQRIADAEAKRLADEEAAKAEQAKREADQAHRTAVKTKAKEAIMSCGADEDTARKIVVAIIAREIPHVSLAF